MTTLVVAKKLAAGLFVVALPLLFGTAVVRWMVSDAGWYRAGFEKYGASERTGIPPEDLSRVSEPMSQYLLLQRDQVDDLTVRQRGEIRPLFNERENKHMKDVRDLLARFYTLQLLAGVYALGFLMASRWWLKGSRWPHEIGRLLRWGGALTFGIIGSIGAMALVDFSQFWYRFHIVSFENDLWQLDPTTDNLINMVPQGFWYDSAVRFATLTLVEAVTAMVGGTWLVSRCAAGSSPRPG